MWDKWGRRLAILVVAAILAVSCSGSGGSDGGSGDSDGGSGDSDGGSGDSDGGSGDSDSGGDESSGSTEDAVSPEVETVDDYCERLLEELSDLEAIDRVEGPDIETIERATDLAEIEARNACVLEMKPTIYRYADGKELVCEYDDIIIDESNLEFVEQVFPPDLLGRPSNEVEFEDTGFVQYPSADLAGIVSFVDENFEYEGFEGRQATRQVLAALGISPNNRSYLGPRINGGPATDPLSRDEPASFIEFPQIPDGAQKVLVLDTGRLEEHEDYFGGDVDVLAADPRDLIEPYAGHGSFIAGLMQLNSPEPIDIDVFSLFNSEPVYDLHLLKLVMSLGNLDSYSAANMSFGGYACPVSPEQTDPDSMDPLDFFEPVAQRRALQHLLEASPGLVIAAAAGNDGRSQPFFPAAFGYASEFPSLIHVKSSLDLGKATDLEAVDVSGPVVSVGADVIEGSQAYSNVGTWVEVPDQKGCHVSLSPSEVWEYGIRNGPGLNEFRSLDTGWVYWCGTSFAAPYWLTMEISSPTP